MLQISHIFKLIFKFIKILLGLYLVFFVGQYIYLLNKSDISFKPVSDISLNEESPPVYLVSYGGGHDVFRKNQRAQAYSALDKGVNRIMMYSKADYEPAFYEKNKLILDQKRGAGYWLWKPYFILKTMKDAPEGAIIVYADSSMVFTKPLQKFVDLLASKSVLILSSKGKFDDPAGATIRREALDQFGLGDDETRKMSTLMAGFVILKNNASSRQFVERWLELCQVPEYVMDAPPGLKNQYPEFMRNEHDQAMLFVTWRSLPKDVGVLSLADIDGYIKNVHRHPDQESMSLLPSIMNSYGVSKFGYNSRWMMWLREKM